MPDDGKDLTLGEWRERAERAESFRRAVVVAAVIVLYAWVFRDHLIALLQKLPALDVT